MTAATGARFPLSDEAKFVNVPRLDLGCGQFKKQGFFGIDNSKVNPLNNEPTNADMQWDLNKGIPAKDNSVEHLFMSHFFEHVRAPVSFLEGECWRVCKAGATVEIIVPMYDVDYPGHLTCFFRDWFERNVDPAKFKIVHKHIELGCEVHDYHNMQGMRKFDELRVNLEVLK